MHTSVNEHLRDTVQNPPVMSPEFKRRALRVTAAIDPDAATGQTVDIMRALIERSARDPLLKDAANTAVRQYANGGPIWAARGVDPFRGDSSLRARALAEACWWYAKHQLRFVHHAKQIDVWLNERDQLQLLIEPSVLLRFPFRMEGDCAIYTMLVAAMLEALGLQWEIVTAAVDPRQPRIFSHVWPRVILPNGQRMALDASHGAYPGWAVPLEHRSRVRVWARDGAPVADAGEMRFAGLHGYQRRRGFGTIGPSDVPDSGGTLDPGADFQEGGSYVPPTGAGPYLSETNDPGFQTPPYDPRGGFTAPAQNSSAWPAFFAQLAKSGMTLAEINAIQPGTVVGPNGQILRQSPGYAVPVGQTITGSFGAISTPMLAIGAALIGGMILLSSKR